MTRVNRRYCVLWNGYFDSAVVLSLWNNVWQPGIVKCLFDVLYGLLSKGKILKRWK
jgi:hypothetical protein